MTQKTKILRTLTMYFMEKGKIMTNREYKQQDDKPIKSSNVIRVLGSWGRIPKMIKKNFPEEYGIIMSDGEEAKQDAADAVIKAANKEVITEPVNFQKGKEEKELEEKEAKKPAKPGLKDDEDE